jgi:membrane-bound serine protease (ClpP class)
VREAVTLTASEAQRENVVDIVAADLPALLAQIDGRQIVLPSGKVTLATKDLSTLDLPPDARHRLLSVIANPSFALILMMIGIYGLIFEFSSPGFGIPGTVGAICLLLAMFALQMLPVNYAGLALILLGMGCSPQSCCRRALACSGSAAWLPSLPGPCCSSTATCREWACR